MKPSEIDARDLGPGPGLRRLSITKSQRGGRYEPGPLDYPMFDHVEFRSVQFDGVSFASLHAVASTFTGCTFRDVEFQSGTFSGYPQSTFRECDFDSATLLGISPGHARFESCKFERTRIRKWIATCAEFVDCQFSGRVETTKFFGRPSGVCAEQVDRSINEFRGNDFRRAALFDVGFVAGIDLDAQKLPVGDEYIVVRDFRERAITVRGLIADWQPDERRQADTLLKAYSTGGMEDQRDLFARRDEISTVPTHVRDRVWKLLEESKN
jgi:hypothetical protein